MPSSGQLALGRADKGIIRNYEWNLEAGIGAREETLQRTAVTWPWAWEGLPAGIAWTSKIHCHAWGSAPHRAQVMLPGRSPLEHTSPQWL